MQAIITKYLGATNTRGSRIRASAERGSITVSYPYEMSGSAVHEFAAQKLVEKFAASDLDECGTPIAENPWLRPRVSGGLPNGATAHVFIG